MRAFNRMTVSRRLTCGFGGVAALIVVAAAVALWTISSIVGNVNRLSSSLDANAATLRLQVAVAEMHGAHSETLRAEIGDAAARARFDDAAETARDRLAAARQTAGAALAPKLNEVAAALDDYGQLDRAAQRAGADGDQVALDAALADMDAVYSAVMGIVGDVSSELSSYAAAQQRAGNATAQRSTLLMVSAAVSVFLSTVAVGLLIARSVVRPLHGLRDAMTAIADGNGDLTRRVDDSGEDEVAAVAKAFNRFVAAMQQSVAAVAEHAGTLLARSDQLGAIASSMAAAAARTRTQAGSVSAAAGQMSGSAQSVAASATQMAGAIDEISASAHLAAETATAAAEANNASAEVMGRLTESSQEITEVVDAISFIAEQTRVLAMNAKIEAARAGEAGRGFTVVANEVKGLAQKSAERADAVKRQVERLQSDIAAAAAAASVAADVVRRIHESQMTIAAAVEQQTASTMEIGRSVEDLAGGTSDISDTIGEVAVAAAEASSGAESTERAADDLAALAGQLRGLVAQFRF